MRNILLACLILNCPLVSAADVTVNFKANLRATTCTINIEVGSSKAVNQTINYGILTWADIEAKGSNTRKDFYLQYSDCYITSSGSKVKQTLNWIQTKPDAGVIWAGYPKEMKGGNVGVAGMLYRTSELNTALSLNNDQVVTWSDSERSNGKLPLTLFLRPTSYSTTQHGGNFNATLTFTTTYQ